ncbi:MAG: porin [Planctomycetota bacterium]|jgi:hypothetical protein
MRRNNRPERLIGTVVVGLTLPCVAGTGTDPSAGDLQERIAGLEAKSARDDARIAEMEARLMGIEAQTGDRWLTERRAEEIRHLVGDVLADADTRSSLSGSGLTAGYEDGFVISSSDGNWLLRTDLLMQQRFVMSEQSGSPTDDSRWGFENARTKVVLSGHVIQPDWFYRVEVDLARANTGLPNGESRTGLGDAFAGYDFGQGWRFWVGTFKTPLLREELLEPQYQLAVDRSVVNYVYTGGRTDGIVVDYRNAKFHLTGSYNNGIDDGVYGGAVMTGGTDPISTPTTDLAFTFRGEWLLAGAWDQTNEFTSPRGEDTAMMLGGAVHYQIADDAATGVPDLDLLLMTLDFTGRLDGTSLFAEFIYAYADMSTGTADALAIVLQGGYYVADTLELYARYEWSDTDTIAPSDINILTIGFNKYLANQNAKWTTDFGVAFDEVPFGVPITGWRADTTGNDNQVVVRSQLQILF